MAGLSIGQERNLHPLRWILGIIIVLLLAAVSYNIYLWYTTGARPLLIPLPASAYADGAIDETPLSSEQISSYKVPATHPRYISIAAIGLNKTPVSTVGLSGDNVLNMPQTLSEAGWFDQSAYPGQGYGTVLIDGRSKGVSHEGVFANVGELKIGDKIVIERGDGKKFTYDVVSNTTVSFQDSNTTGIKRLLTPYRAGQEGLGLVASAGNWIPRDHIFSERILIQAVAE